MSTVNSWRNEVNKINVAALTRIVAHSGDFLTHHQPRWAETGGHFGGIEGRPPSTHQHIDTADHVLFKIQFTHCPEAHGVLQPDHLETRHLASLKHVFRKAAVWFNKFNADQWRYVVTLTSSNTDSASRVMFTIKLPAFGSIAEDSWRKIFSVKNLPGIDPIICSLFLRNGGLARVARWRSG